MLSKTTCILMAWFSGLLVVLNFVSGLGAAAENKPLWLIGVKFGTAVIWSAGAAIWASAARNRS